MSWRKSLFGRTASRTPSSTISKNKVREEEDAVEAIYSECWGTLCTDLLLEILKRVEAGTDSRWNILSCAGVCRRWRDVSREMMVGRISVPGNFMFPSCLKQPGPRNHPHQCLVIRDKKNSTFYLYLALNASFTDKGKFFLAAKRCRDNAHTEYIISIDANDISQGSNAYVGKLRSDFMGTSFTIYDSQPPLNGEGHSNNKSNRRVASKQISPQVPKGNFKVGQVSYKLNLLKSKSPRRMVCAVNYPLSDKHTSHQLKENFQGRKHETSSNSCTILSNRTPRWHEQLQCWCLNFHGRATVASVKNFQLVARVDQRQPKGKGDEEIVLLQFGKVAGDTFTLDYRQPLSAFQAFAICLTSFGTKLACE